jgi:DNA-binding MarR family transcriptional regulator
MCDHAQVGEAEGLPPVGRSEVDVADERRGGPLDPVVQAARDELANVGLPADRILVLRALWRELLIGFTQQLGEHGLGFSQLATLYAAAGTEALSIADLATILGRSPSATSRIVSGLARRGLVSRAEEVADRRQRLVTPTPAGMALLGTFDRARAEQFLAVVRPLPMAERAMVAMGVAALASRAMSRRGRLIKAGSRR